MSQMKAYNFPNPRKNSNSTFKCILFCQICINTGDMSLTIYLITYEQKYDPRYQITKNTK